MNNIEKFNETVGILVKAYMNDTLSHNDCAACAVGNIIAAKIGANVVNLGGWSGGGWVRNGGEICVIWDEVFITSEGKQEINPEKYKGWAKRQIDMSGYSLHELAKIEYAFETCEKPSENPDNLDSKWMFNGLMAVVDALAEIHGIDLEQKESAKLMFVK